MTFLPVSTFFQEFMQEWQIFYGIKDDLKI
jgi:hypothetical protein